ncbi:MAG TPA: diacylglycerol kinase family protein [Polyangiaceae bacterium]|nr:diacylglycerol kinase family protein [Polyangiaceae bacterium]
MMQDDAYLYGHDQHQPSVPAFSKPRAYGHGPFFILINSSSGRQAQRREELIRQSFTDAGASAYFVSVQQTAILPTILRHAADLANNAQGTLVVAGGDGTINTALPHVLRYGVPLGILPCGTFNYAARDLGIPLDIAAAVHTLMDGDVVDAKLGLVSGRPFLVNASLGLYPRLLEDREQAKQKYGRNRILALTAAASSLFARRARTFNIEVQRASGDAEPVGAPHQLEIATLFIGNNALQLQRLGLNPASDEQSTDDRSPSGKEGKGQELTALALRTPSPLRLFELGLRAAFGSLGEAKDVLTFPFEQLIVSEHSAHHKGIKLALDGEVMRIPGPLIIEPSPVPIRVIVPAAERASSPRLAVKRDGLTQDS